MIILGNVGQNIKALADFHQTNSKKNPLEVNKEGERLENGNFVFSMAMGDYKIMVLTRNNGEYIESGYMKQTSVNESNWKDPANWNGKLKNSYYITHFQGHNGMILFL